MSIKSLFDKKSFNVSTSPKTSEGYSDVESINLVGESNKANIRFIPNIDFEDPTQFARYGLAEKYYEDAIKYIYNTYPYDGSLYERKKWHNDSSDLVNYFFDHKFPRKNGFINIGQNYGTSSIQDENYYSSSVNEYIYFKGTYNDGNKYDPSKNREYNLKIDGVEGNTVEFYFKRDNFSGSHKQVILDVWNGNASGSSNYGRMTIEVHPGITTEKDKIYLQISSGSDGYTNFELGQNLDFTGSWHHYAISYQNSGSIMKAQLLVDGNVVDTASGGTSIGRIYGAMQGQLGSLITTASNTTSTQRGWGKLSGSLDEFRFWKKKRTERQISLNYFTPIGGGTNTDDSNTDLGIYYKFNEGIFNSLSISPYDKIILDYSGRVTNGTWIGYSLGSRDENSGMVLSKLTNTEFKDPVVYGEHQEIKILLDQYRLSGYEHDSTNATSLYNSLPSWKIDEDSESGESTKNLIQMISEIFDSLHNQIKFLPSIKNVQFNSENPLPFSMKLLENAGLEVPDIFSNIDLVEEFLSRNETQMYSEDISKLKNFIYQNIYNNLLSIYKSKGTMKSIRNLLHTFGIDENLVEMKMYADNAEILIKDRFSFQSIEKNIISFNHPDDFGAVIYQEEDISNPNSLNHILASSDIMGLGSTLEVEIFFPEKFEKNDVLFFPFNYITSSLFGIHENAGDLWASTDRASIQVFAIRTELESKDGYIQLSSSCFNIKEKTPLIKDLYSNRKWNFGVRICPDKYPFIDLVNGSSLTTQDFRVELYGVSYEQDILQEEIMLSASIDYNTARDYYLGTKKIYIGAHRINFNGDIVTETGEEIDKQYSDIEFVSARYWNSYLEDETIKMHSKDSTSYGAKDSSHKTARQVYNLANSLLSASIEQNDTLALHWNYINRTSGSSSFIIDDFSSGSVDAASKDYISEFSKYQQTGKAEFFDSLESSKKKYVTSAVLKNYENITSEDLINIISEYDDIYETEKKIVNHYFVLEKSMFSVISKEMLSWLGNVKEFNNIIGTPSDRYKENYSHLRYLRSLFFRNVENDPDYDRYIQFYKWIDDSIFFLVKQLIPVSANYDPGVTNIVESHVFERNKYKHKFPTLEFSGDTPSASFKAVGELLYPWSIGHAPISGLENENCLWWNIRAERKGILNSDRAGIFAAIKSQTDRRFSAPYILTFEKVPRTNVKPYPSPAEIGGVILTKKRLHDIIINTVGFDITGLNGLQIPDLIPPREDCED